MMDEFQTYDGKRCGDCKIRLRTSGFCIHQLESVNKGDPACRYFKDG